MNPKQLALMTVLAVSAFCNTSAYASSTAQTKIIGGSNVDIIYPWMVSLATQDSDGYIYHYCGGALIDKDWVLTAAHCIEDENDTSDLYLVIGATDYQSENPNEEIIKAESVIVHEAYRNDDIGVNHDIALIKLAESSSLTPIKMASNAQTNGLNEGTALTVIGWGSTEYDHVTESSPPDSYPAMLQKVNIPYRTPAQCAENDVNYNANKLCAGAFEGGVDSCFGDSGGPLFIEQNGEYIHLGIVSYGDGCAVAGNYGVYTRTAAYQSWINGKTGLSIGLGELKSGGGSVSWLLIAALGVMLRLRKSIKAN